MTPGSRAARLALGCALALCGEVVPGGRVAQAAHEWRAAWAAPYSLGLIEEQAAGPRETLRSVLALARPFGVAGLTFQRVFVREPRFGWEAHAGLLDTASGYREWHVGCGKTVSCCASLDLLVGVRLFSAGIPPDASHLCGAATLIGRFRPRGMSAVVLEGGIVDLATSDAPGAPAAILVSRASLQAGRCRLLIDRSVSPGAGAETALALVACTDGVRVCQALRCATGEGSLAVGIRCSTVEVSLAQRWHPQLGWTPEISLRWLRPVASTPRPRADADAVQPRTDASTPRERATQDRAAPGAEQ
jgi:hypothetical protein